MTDIEGILAKLTVAEKVHLVAGASAWRTNEIPGLVPLLKVSDGPNGVRGDGGATAASFPVGVCMASTWNIDLIEQVGAAIAEEAQSKSVDVVLGPTINIQRTPLGGRNFECYSEDPLLSGELAVAFTNGVQDGGVGACLKHYVCNDSEFERHTISVEVDERTLREIYLRPFEMAIKRSHPWTVMASYNRIDGVWACSHDRLVNQVLKGEWEYDGLVISDWFAAKETVPNALGGLDLEMPGPPFAWGDKLLDAVHSGEVSETIIDDKVRRLLLVLDRTGKFEQPEDQAEQSINKPTHQKVSYQAAAEGMVLLKNNGLLPLDTSTLKQVAVIGPNTHEYRIMGGGSSSLRPHYVTTPVNALAEKVENVKIHEHIGCLTHKYIPTPDRNLLRPSPDSDVEGLLYRCYEKDLSEDPVLERVVARGTLMLGGMISTGAPEAASLEGIYTPEATGLHEVGLLSTGSAKLYLGDDLLIDNATDTSPGDAFFQQATSEKRTMVALTAGEPVSIRIEFNADVKNSFRAFRYGILPPQPEDSIAEAAALAAKVDAVILMVGTNDDWETEGNDREMLALPGDQDRLIEAVIAANPNTVVVNNSGSPIAMPWVAAAPAIIQTWFPGQEFGNALTDILLGKVNPSGKLPITFPQKLEDTPAFTSYPGEFGKVYYGEGLYAGYRWYTSRQIAPLFAFGHGLSYSTFTIADITAPQRINAGENCELELTLTNTGTMAGSETLQVYIQPLKPSVARPKLELKAFTKIQLQPGEQKQVTITLTEDAFNHWDLKADGWLVSPGEYDVHVGNASDNLMACHRITIS